MDSITQGLLGATIAEAGFRRRLGSGSVAWATFCGVAPDLDLVAMVGGEWNELVHHRGVSHSLVALTLAAPLLGALAWRWPGKRQGTRLDWIHLTWWALITHPLLDVCTSYGTQLFAPLSVHRFAIDSVSIVDPAYTVWLLVAVIVGRLAKDLRTSARLAAGMLALSTAYLAFGWVQSQRAIAWAEEELAAQRFAPVEIRALPTIANLFVFRAVARDGDGRFRVALLSLSAPRTPRWYALESDEDPLVDAAFASERGHIFQWFAMEMAQAELQHEDHGFVVRMRDLRYGAYRDPRFALWGANARFTLEGELQDVERWNTRGDLDMEAELATLWAHVVGDDATIRDARAALALGVLPQRRPVPRDAPRAVHPEAARVSPRAHAQPGARAAQLRSVALARGRPAHPAERRGARRVLAVSATERGGAAEARNPRGRAKW